MELEVVQNIARPQQVDDYNSSFNAHAYCAQNYDSILPEDRFLINFVIRSNVIRDLGIAPKTFNTAVDVGTGGAMIGPALMSPFVEDNGSLLLTDIGYSQLHLSQRTVRKMRRGNLGRWQKFSELMANTDHSDALQRIGQVGKVERLSVFDLEPLSVDAGTMFYVAESITSSKEDFEIATRRFFDAIRPGGLLIWATILGSQGYDSPGELFHAYWIDAQDMLDIAEDYVRDMRFVVVPSSDCARRKEGPKLTGMAMVIGVKQ